MIRSTLQVVATALACSGLAAAAQEPLSQKTTNNLDEAVQVYHQGRLGEALRLAETVLQSASPEQLPLADRRLHDEHQLEMSLVGLASFCRVELVLAGQGARLGRPPAAELPAALEALDDRIALLLEPVRRELEIGMPAIIPDDVLTEKIDASRPLLTQVDQAALLQSHIQQLASRVRAADRAQLEERPRDIARRKLPDEQKKLEQLRDRVTTRLVEFSLVRLNNSLDTLVDDRANFQNRFAATQKAGESLATLHTNWNRYKRAKQHTGGLDPNVEQRWRRQEELVRIQSGPLLQKVYHFTEGTRWWLRGRYGRGPIGGGLAKAIPEGLNQEQVMQWLTNSPLFMPPVLRKPQNPLNVPVPFPVARRHLEWWRLETRVPFVEPVRLLATFPSESMADTSLLSDARFNAIPARRFVVRIGDTQPADARLAQLVGYVEYSNALAHFETLLQMTTQAEQRSLDDLVGQHDQFVVHSVLSSKYDSLEPASMLRLPRHVPDPRAAHPSERRGLRWIIALARVELGAMRAGYTGVSAIPMRQLDYANFTGNPAHVLDGGGSFDRWPPTPFDRDAFLEILFDGARQHYYESRTVYRLVPGLGRQEVAGRQEVLGQAVTPRIVNTPEGVRLLQFERKLALTIEMVEAVRQFTGGSLSPAQEAELNQWTNWLGSQYAIVQRAFEPPN